MVGTTPVCSTLEKLQENGVKEGKGLSVYGFIIVITVQLETAYKPLQIQ